MQAAAAAVAIFHRLLNEPGIGYTFRVSWVGNGMRGDVFHRSAL
jgi:hypothetical protein